MHEASGVGARVQCGPLCAATGRGPLLGSGPEPPPLYLAASALPLPPATLPALGDAPELRSFHAHVAMAMHMAAACLRATADIGLHRQQRGGSRQNTPTDGTSASPGASAGA